jgi:hypothetical protein
MDAITALTHGAVARNDMDAAIEARQQKELARGQRTVDAVYDV